MLEHLQLAFPFVVLFFVLIFMKRKNQLTEKHAPTPPFARGACLVSKRFSYVGTETRESSIVFLFSVLIDFVGLRAMPKKPEIPPWHPDDKYDYSQGVGGNESLPPNLQAPCNTKNNTKKSKPKISKVIFFLSKKHMFF